MQNEQNEDVRATNDDAASSNLAVPTPDLNALPPGHPARAGRPVLPEAQEIALLQLATGSSIAKAAEAARVDRRTVHRWIRSNPHFAAAYNEWRREMLDSGRTRLVAMTNLALDTVKSAMLQGDARVAFQVAKATGVMDIPKPGLTEPGRLYRRKRLRDVKWQEELAKAELHEAFNKRSRESHRHPDYCEYMIDTYIKCRSEALAEESPDNRARRLEEQPKYHRNYLPITLRIFGMLDAEAAPAPNPAPPDDPPLAAPSSAVLPSAPVPPADPAASTESNSGPALSARDDDDADDADDDEQLKDDFAARLAKFF
jgi:hypothetical protein